MARLIYILVGVMLVLLNTYLFSHTQVNYTVYEEANDHLRFLSHSEEMLRHDVVRIRYSLLPNYDPIVNNLYKMQLLVAEIEQGPISTHALGISGFSPTLERLKQAISTKSDISGDFKESNSILKNSIAYFLVTSSELIAQTSQAVPNNAAYTIGLSELPKMLLSYSLSGEKTPPALIQNWINRFEAIQLKLPKILRDDVAGLIKHAQVIKEYQGRTDNLLLSLLNVSVEKDIQLLVQGYQQRFDAEKNRARIYRSLLYASSLLLLAYLAIIILRLRGMASKLTQSNTALHTEILEREQVEQALRASEKRIQTLYDSTPDMYFTISEEGVVLSVNQFGASALGYEQDELINHSVWEIVHPDDLLTVKQQIYHIFKQGKEYEEIEFRKLCKDGAVCWVHERISLITRKSGVRELRIACRDVTDRKRVEEESRERQAQLAHLARVNTMGEMASGLAHELNQPLTAISTYASACLRMLQSGPKTPEKLAYGLEQTAIQARRAGEIIRRLREFIRKDTYQRTIIDVNALVTEVIGFTDPETRGKGIRLELDLNNHLPPVQGTGIQIEQVILNLVRNGIDSIHLSGNEEGTVVVGTSIDSQGSVLVSVKDNGQGLEKKHAKQIFEPFHTTKSDGMGMGLSISRSIIEAHEGRLWFDSNDGVGTTFYFTIPAEQGVNVA